MEPLEAPGGVEDLSDLGDSVAFTCRKCAPSLDSLGEERELIEAAAGCLDTLAVGITGLLGIGRHDTTDDPDLSDVGEYAFTCAHCGTAWSCGRLARRRLLAGVPPPPEEMGAALVGLLRVWVRLAALS